MTLFEPTRNLKLHTLFNLGRHLNNYNNVFSSDALFLFREGNERLIQEPWKFIQQQQLFIQLLTALFKAGDTVRVFNTHSVFLDHYCYAFEGTNVVYHNQPWTPGTFSNPLLGFSKPTLAVVISGRAEDLSFRVNEITISGVPLINLSPQQYPASYQLFTSLTLSHRHYIHYYIQLILFLVTFSQKKMLQINPTSTTSLDLQDFREDIFFGFAKLKPLLITKPCWLKTNKLSTRKKSSIYCVDALFFILGFPESLLAFLPVKRKPEKLITKAIGILPIVLAVKQKPKKTIAKDVDFLPIVYRIERFESWSCKLNESQFILKSPKISLHIQITTQFLVKLESSKKVNDTLVLELKNPKQTDLLYDWHVYIWKKISDKMPVQHVEKRKKIELQKRSEMWKSLTS